MMDRSKTEMQGGCVWWRKADYPVVVRKEREPERQTHHPEGHSDAPPNPGLYLLTAHSAMNLPMDC